MAQKQRKGKWKMKSSDMLNQICSVTFTRHAGMKSEEFLKEIGKETAENEATAVREAKMALMVGIMKELSCAVTRLQVLNIHQKTLQEVENNG